MVSRCRRRGDRRAAVVAVSALNARLASDDTFRNLSLLTRDKLPLVVEGSRLYAPAPIELEGTDTALATVSLDVTCPEQRSSRKRHGTPS